MQAEVRNDAKPSVGQVATSDWLEKGYGSLILLKVEDCINRIQAISVIGGARYSDFH
jgi:hypothetical protein